MPIISVIIVNYNGKNLLPRCLRALDRQTFQDFEVIIVDNGSTDGSLELIDREQAGLTVLELGRNTGFAGANNRGAEIAKGEWLALLNSDAFPDPDWLEQLMIAAERHPDAFFSSHQYCYHTPEIMDGTGDMLAPSGRAWRRDYQAPETLATNHTDEVFGACAAASLYRRNHFEEVGGFDEDYFCHFEDVDLSFRLRLAGYHCIHAVHAVVYHVGSATAGGELSNFALYQGFRNSVWTYVKCMPGPLLRRYWWRHVMQNLREIRTGFVLGKGRVVLRSKRDALMRLPRMIRKRKAIQASRRIDVTAIDAVLTRQDRVQRSQPERSLP